MEAGRLPPAQRERQSTGLSQSGCEQRQQSIEPASEITERRCFLSRSMLPRQKAELPETHTKAEHCGGETGAFVPLFINVSRSRDGSS